MCETDKVQGLNRSNNINISTLCNPSSNNTESDDVPGVVLQLPKSDPADECPPSIPPKKRHEFKDNPEDFEHGDEIKYVICYNYGLKLNC